MSTEMNTSAENISAENTSLLRSTNIGGNVYRVYRKRWFVLLVVTLINFSNGILWITFAPVADKAATYFGVSTSIINWLSLVFPFAALICSIISAWFIDTYGLRAGILFAAWLNGLGGVVRVVSTLPHVGKENRIVVDLFGQSLAAVAQTLLLPLPPKLAALWFGDSQRVFANMITSTSNTVGILVANILSPTIVKVPRDIQIMLAVFAAPGVLGTILATCGITSSRPPTPPSLSASEPSETFLSGLTKAMKSKSFLVLMVCFGSGIGMFSAFTTLLEQIICVHNYSDTDAGYMTALAIGFGFIGAGIASLYVDKTKQFEMTAKICFTFATLFVILFGLTSLYKGELILIGFSVSGFGFFALALLPVCLELGVECTYPVAEATSASLLWLFGQVAMILIVLVAEALGTDISSAKSKNLPCQSGNLDLTHATYFMAIYTVVIALVFVLFFRPKLQRLQAERQERHLEPNQPCN